MIVCPNCSQDNADESAHCGFCGHQLQEGGKKTMFGLAALNSDQIRAAAEAAKAAQAAQSAPEQPAPVAPSFNLPKPSGLGQPGGAPSFNLDAGDGADAFAKTEMMPSIGSEVSQPAIQPAPKKDPFADEFAALEASFGNDPDFNAPVDPTPTGPQDIMPDVSGPSQMGGGFGATQPQNNPTTPASAGFNSGPTGGAPTSGAPTGGGFNAGPGFGAAPAPANNGFNSGPSSMGGAPNQAMQKAPGQAVQKKKSNKVFIVVGILGFVSVTGCIAAGVVAKMMNLF